MDHPSQFANGSNMASISSTLSPAFAALPQDDSGTDVLAQLAGVLCLGTTTRPALMPFSPNAVCCSAQSVTATRRIAAWSSGEGARPTSAQSLYSREGEEGLDAHCAVGSCHSCNCCDMNVRAFASSAFCFAEQLPAPWLAAAHSLSSCCLFLERARVRLHLV
jgi:hypothetical protein